MTCPCGKMLESVLKRDVHMSTVGDEETHGAMPFELAQVGGAMVIIDRKLGAFISAEGF